MTDLDNQLDSESVPAPDRVLAPVALARTERLSEQRRALLAQRLRRGPGRR